MEGLPLIMAGQQVKGLRVTALRRFGAGLEEHVAIVSLQRLSDGNA